MHILFATQQRGSGVGIVRASWPARWINKFTEHTAAVVDESDLQYSDSAGHLSGVDVCVIHQASPVLLRFAKQAHAAKVPIVFDTDDNTDALYGEYRITGYLSSFTENIAEIIGMSRAITAASIPLARRMEAHGLPVALIPNGYDVTLPEYRIAHEPYYEGSRGEWLKIVYGGSTGHSRDIAMFLDLGVVEALSEYRIDWHFYGALRQPPKRKEVSQTSTVFFSPGADISKYLSLYADASILIAPLVIDEFNHCRSAIKPTEAGLVGIPAVVSDIEGYRDFSPGTICVQNTRKAWASALRELIENEDKRTLCGQANRKEVYDNYTAQAVTQRRTAFYENL